MKLSAFLTIGLLIAASTSAADKPMNLLFIAVDDLRPELGCYGVPYADSPNLDRFANSAATFQRHYVQVATCGASRYAMMTGRSPIHSGGMGNGAFSGGKSALKKEEQPGAQTWPELFRRSGYHTTLIGKMSHTADGRVFAYSGKGDGREEVPLAWSDLATPMGSWKRGWGIFFAYENGRHREDGKGNKDLMEFAVQRDQDLPDGLMADAAIHTLQAEAKKQRPFVLGLGFFKPHLPFVAPEQDWEHFKEKPVPAPPHPQKIDSPHWHGSGEFYKYDMPFEKSKPMKDNDTRDARRAYLACVRYVDRQIGRVLSALEETGLADNTVVVVWGDHGWQLGDTALWGKHTPFERANRSVLMIRTPGMKTAGQKITGLAETLDLYPTLIDVCQPSFRKTEFPLDGVSLKPLLDGTASSVRDTAVSYWRGSVSVRSDQHRLIVKPKTRKKAEHVELYDMSLSDDPVQNIAADFPDVVQRLKAQIPQPIAN